MSESSNGGKVAIAVLCGIAVLSAGLLLFGGRSTRTTDQSCLPTTGPGPIAPPGEVMFPLTEGSYTIGDGFGARGGTHQGVDLAAPAGTPIHAAADGIVSAAGTADGFGHWVVIDSQVDGQKVSTVYGHEYANGVLVSKGQQVHAGDHIADVGADGQATGPHLHLEVWPGGRFDGGHPVDPLAWFAHAKTAPTAGSTSPGTSPSPGRTTAASPSEVDVTTSAAGPADVQLAAAENSDGVGCGTPPGIGGLDVAKMLAEYPAAAPFVPWLLKAASTCPDTPAPLIAAQLRNESGFQKVTSPAGAVGYAQFLPGTWAKYGVDTSDKGYADPNDIGDAVMSMAKYDCTSMTQVRKGLADGSLHGDDTALMLSLYNCGPRTMQFGTTCPYTETQNYVTEIPATARRWSLPTPESLSGSFGDRVVQAARRWLGTPYAWGGGSLTGPSQGKHDGDVADRFGDYNKIGFDCSGLTRYAVAAASGQTIVLPGYTVSQLDDPRGKPVAPAALLPGDLVFPGGGQPDHVAIFAGDHSVIEAPQSGGVVQVSSLASLGPNFDARRFGSTP